MKWYNFEFDALPVTFHLKTERRFLWQRIIGLQVGDWFIGAIKGRIATPVDDGSQDE